MVATSDDNVELICKLIDKESRLSLHVSAAEIGISKDSVRRILIHKLHKIKICSLWVPHHLCVQN